MVIKIKRNLSPLFYKALVSGAARRWTVGKVGTAGGYKQAANRRGLMERKTDE